MNANATNNPDVLIAGAGPVGLTMAATLAHHGLSYRIIDQAPRATDKSKALVVWSRTLELLHNLGAAEVFVKSGMKARGASIYGNGQKLVHLTIDGVKSPYGFPLMIPQSETERLLSEHLQSRGVQVERSVELLSFDDRDDQIAPGESVVSTLRHADGREEIVRSAWLIGCDGAHSTVRHTLKMEFTGEAEQDDWLLADVHVHGPIAAEEISVFWHEKGILVFFPITPGRYRVVADLGRATDAARPADPTLVDVQAMIDERGPADVRISDPVWLAGFRINERKVADYRRGRVFLAGDAAHIDSPAGGQGMNTGMQDAFNLGWKLALVHRGLGRPELLDSYSIERSEIGNQVLHNAGKLTHVAMLRNPLAQWLRNHTAAIVGSFGFVQEKIRNTLCELSIHYRFSPLSVEDWKQGLLDLHGSAIRAGDRLPNAPLVDVRTGDSTTLFDALRGTRFSLLLVSLTGDADSIASLDRIADAVKKKCANAISPHLILPATARKVVIDHEYPAWIDGQQEMIQQHGVRHDALILVRPDGYIAYRNQPASAAGLEEYLNRILISI